MNVPIIDTTGIKEEGLIKPDIVLQNYEKLPKHIDTCFMLFDGHPSQELLDDSKVFFEFVGASYKLKQYIYKEKLVLSYAPLGSAAAGGLLEELIALGVKKVIALGSSGLIGEMDPKNILLVEKAIRDEGLSYHYLEPSLYAETTKSLNNLIEHQLKQRNLSYQKGIAWTTDGFYRETTSLLELRKSQGALAVEMECAGLCAVSKYRNISFSQILYFSDIVKQEGWSGFVHDRREIKDIVTYMILDIVMNL